MEQIIINGLLLGAQYALIALGLTLIFSLMNVLNFAHGQLFVLGAFVCYVIYGQLQLPFWLGLVGATAVTAIVGAVFEISLFRTVIRRSSREESTMLLAAATAFFLDAAILLIFSDKQRGVPKIIEGIYINESLDVIIANDRLVIGLVALLIIVSFILFMQYSKPGRAMRALAQDKVAAQLMGVNVEFYGMVGFATGAALAGLIGGLLVTLTGVNSGIGGPISIKAFLMIMIGGAGVVSGAILGGFILGMMESVGLSVLHAYGDITYLVIFLTLMIFLSFKPQGLMGKPWG